MKRALLFTAILAAAILTACSHIDEDERYIYEKLEQADRVVLLEDFTGQRCVNCPRGTEVIEQLQKEFGDKVIAVGIHGGPLGFAGTATAKGLATNVGDEYYDHWKLEYQPVGLVDRHGAVNYSDWAKAVKEELAKTAAVDLKASATLKDGTINMVVEATGKEGTVSGKLQVWVLEDGITAMQMMPDGSTNREYVHNHVFRTAVNGSWGEDMTIHEAETRKQTYTQAVDASWNTANLSIVAFVYNNNGVEQAVKGKVNSEE